MAKVQFQQLRDDDEVIFIITIDGNVYTRGFPEDFALKVRGLINKVRSDDPLYMDKQPLIEELRGYFDKSIRRPFHGDIVQDMDGTLYLKDTSIPIPDELKDRILYYIDELISIDSLINFWKLCLLNPDERAREDVYKFTEKHKLPITDHGYFIAYKSVVPKEDPLLNEFIDKQKTKVPGSFDLNSIYVIKDRVSGVYALSFTNTIANDNLMGSDYDVDDESYSEDGFHEEPEEVEDSTVVGSLGDLIQQRNSGDITFTDIHSRTMTIKTDTVVHMDRKQCDSDPRKDCSYGLHIGGVNYVNSFGAGMKSRRVLLCLINPANTVAVPSYNADKMRVCEYYVYGVSEMEDERIKPIETSYFESDYKDYEEAMMVKKLEELRHLNTDALISGVDIEVAQSIIRSRITHLNDDNSNSTTTSSQVPGV